MLFSALAVLICAAGPAGAAPQSAPGFPELAVLLAKGWFSDYVSPDASLADCAAFLNRRGICFSPFDLLDPGRTVQKEDFARVIGQSRLLFEGSAELENGCIKKPLAADSWVDFCVLNDISLNPLWEQFVEKTGKNGLPEVDRFFNRSRTEAQVNGGE